MSLKGPLLTLERFEHTRPGRGAAGTWGAAGAWGAEDWAIPAGPAAGAWATAGAAAAGTPPAGTPPARNTPAGTAAPGAAADAGVESGAIRRPPANCWAQYGSRRSAYLTTSPV